MSFIEAVIPLASIARLSPWNPRQDTTSNVDTLAATIRAVGVTHPLILWRNDAGEYEVVDGGRRWRALLQNAAAPDARPADEEPQVRALIVEGGEAAAREAALAVSVTPQRLHPVEEYEAFAALQAAGMSEDDIARDFGLGLRAVRQRLALGRLSPRVRAMWKAGEIDSNRAQAFTVGAIEAQDALLDLAENGQPGLIATTHTIRRHLREKALEPGSPLGRFFAREPAHVEAYKAAGGRIEEDLFTETPVILDEAIATRVADAILLRAAEAVAEAEGWGQASVEGEDNDEEPIDVSPDYTEEENARLDEIDAQIRKTPYGAPERQALIDEADAIGARASLRAIPAARRAQLGVRAELTYHGEIEFIRGVPINAPKGETRDARADAPETEIEEETQERVDEPRPTRAADHRRAAPPPPAPTGKIGRAGRAVIDEALNAALHDAARTNGNIALTFAVAALGCQYGRHGVGLIRENAPVREIRSELLARIGQEKFETALATCIAAPLADLTAAMFELIAASIDVSRGAVEDGATLARTASALCDMRKLLARRFDYVEYFAGATKEACADAIREIAGEAEANDAAKQKKDVAAKRAATLAAKAAWLPASISATIIAPPPPKKRARKDPRTTAEAMREAIEADEAEKAGEGAVAGEADED